MFKEKLGLSILIVSLIAGAGLTWQLLKQSNRKHNLTIATFAQEGKYYAFGKALNDKSRRSNFTTKSQYRSK